MFELKIADLDATTGAIPVSWCLDAETLEKLKKEGYTRPHVVIVTAPAGDNYRGHKESRVVAPLQDLMAYVDFKTAGPNNIYAFIQDGSFTEVCSINLPKERGGSYIRDILDYSGRGWGFRFPYLTKEDAEGNKIIVHNDDGAVSQPTFAAPVVLVDVPEEIFAPEPSDWEKAWVNHYYSEKVVDQCHFRRRRMFAYTLQIPVVLLVQVIRTIIFLLNLLRGSREVSLSPVLHPLSETTENALLQFESRTVFIRDVEKNELSTFQYRLRKYWTLPFMPLIWLPILLMAVFAPASALIGCGIAIALIALGLGLVTLLTSKEARQAIRDFFSVEEKPWELSAEEIAMLICNPEKKPLTFATLPSQKKSLKLRFRNLKSKVCRPFSA